MTDLLLCSLVDNNHHWVFKAIAQALSCADGSSYVVFGVCCMSRPILAAEFDMGCTDC